MKLLVMPEWREVPGWEGLYAVSEDGQVKSLPRHRRPYEVVLASQRGKRKPYLCVNLWSGARMLRKCVHVLVLEAFVAPRPPGMLGLHNDDDPNNNHLSNLRWGTASDNSRDIVANGNNPQSSKTHCLRGHPFAGDNLWFVSDGSRRCRACDRLRDAAYRQRKRAA